MLFSELPKGLAYLDPGSGSIIVQLILAALLGIGVFARMQWSRIKKFLGRKDNHDEDKKDEE